MAYVSRAGGKINGVYANPQPGFAEEELPDDNAEVVAFLNPPPPIPTITRPQMLMQMITAGVLTSGEAEAAAQGNAPGKLTAYFAQHGSAAKIRWAAMATIERNGPMAPILKDGLGMTDEEIDSLFTAAALL
jgi:hypothetical protein